MSEQKDPESTRQEYLDDYEGSEFEYDTKSVKTKDTIFKVPTSTVSDSSAVAAAVLNRSTLPSRTVFQEAQSKYEGQVRAYHYASMNAYSKHVKLVNEYLKYYSKGKSLSEVFARDTSSDRTDLDVIREEMKFIWDEEDDADTWSKRLAKKYYDKLFKEYCICDLSYYKMNKIAMRWRVEKEVLQGKGQFICGNKACSERKDLKSWEVNFGYVEHGEKKNALVKLRLCPDCSDKLNFHHKKKEYIKPKRTSQQVVEDIKDDSKTTKKRKRSEQDEQEDIEEKKTNKSPVNESKVSSESKTEGNSIVITGDDSIWRVDPEKAISKANQKTQEDEFEDYLEDLFF